MLGLFSKSAFPGMRVCAVSSEGGLLLLAFVPARGYQMSRCFLLATSTCNNS